jgi:hypothetical protein
MNAIQDGPVFSSEKAAYEFVTRWQNEGTPVVRRYPVQGDAVESRLVYTSSRYDPLDDVHHFEAVYGTWDAAKQAAGDRGIALSRTIDEAASPDSR